MRTASSKTLATVVAGLLAFTAVGCSSDSANDGAKVDTNTSATAIESGQTESSQANSAMGLFGADAVELDDVAVSVSAPHQFDPPEGGPTEPSAAYVSFDITIENISDGEVDPTRLAVDLASSGEAGVSAYDPDSPTDYPADPLASGETITVTFGFGVADIDDLELTVTPDFQNTDDQIRFIAADD